MKNEYIHQRWSAKEKKMLARQASKIGLTESAYLRMLITVIEEKGLSSIFGKER